MKKIIWIMLLSLSVAFIVTGMFTIVPAGSCNVPKIPYNTLQTESVGKTVHELRSGNITTLSAEPVQCFNSEAYRFNICYGIQNRQEISETVDLELKLLIRQAVAEFSGNRLDEQKLGEDVTRAFNRKFDTDVTILTLVVE